MRRALGWLFSLVAFGALPVSCAKPLSELEPYPCALDGTCPGGRACVPGAGCMVARLDAACQESSTDCRKAAGTATCTLGVCAEACNERQACAADRVCTVRPGLGNGGCVLACGANAACPPGLLCRSLGYDGLSGCVGAGRASALDGACASDQDCASAGGAVKCLKGACTTACRKAADCGTGHVCSAPEGNDGACLPDCSMGRGCTDGLVCNPLWYDGKFGCMGQGAKAEACASVEVGFACSEACGTYLVDGKVACANGRFCGSGSTCSGPGTCSCEAGSLAKTCTGEPCNGSNCAESWWCEPQAFGAVGCESALARFGVTCHCKNGSERPIRCGAKYSCEQICADECDLLKQDCPDPERPKCSEIIGVAGHSQTACVPLTGQKQIGEACMRRGAALTDTGHDDCDKGLYCSLLGINPNRFSCRPHCSAARACPENEICVLSSWANDTTSSIALCKPACDPLDATACAELGMRCKYYSNDKGYCTPAGSAAEGEACEVSGNCAGNMTCVGTGRCASPCDATYPCAAGFECRLAPGNAVGVCSKPGAR